METLEISRIGLEYFMQCKRKFVLKEQGIKLNQDAAHYLSRGTAVHKIISSVFRYGDTFEPLESGELAKKVNEASDDTLIKDIMYAFIMKYGEEFAIKQNEKHLYPEVKIRINYTMRNTQVIFKSIIDSLFIRFDEHSQFSEINEFKTVSSDKNVDNEFYVLMNFQVRAYVGALFHAGLNPKVINYHSIKFPKGKLPTDLTELFTVQRIKLDGDYVTECGRWLHEALYEYIEFVLSRKEGIKNFSNCHAFYGMPCQYLTMCAGNLPVDEMVEQGWFKKDLEKHEGAMFEYNPTYRVFERIADEQTLDKEKK